MGADQNDGLWKNKIEIHAMKFSFYIWLLDYKLCLSDGRAGRSGSVSWVQIKSKGLIFHCSIHSNVLKVYFITSDILENSLFMSFEHVFLFIVNTFRKQSVVVWLFTLTFEISRGGSQHRIHGMFERALAVDRFHKSVLLWRCYIAYELTIACNPSAARRVFFRAIHACPW